MNDILRVDWCALCSSKPAEGRLGLRMDGEDEPVYVLACAKCAAIALDNGKR